MTSAALRTLAGMVRVINSTVQDALAAAWRFAATLAIVAMGSLAARLGLE